MSRIGVREGRSGPAARSGASPRAMRRPSGAFLIENPEHREAAAWGAGEPGREEARSGDNEDDFSAEVAERQGAALRGAGGGARRGQPPPRSTPRGAANSSVPVATERGCARGPLEPPAGRPCRCWAGPDRGSAALPGRDRGKRRRPSGIGT